MQRVDTIEQAEKIIEDERKRLNDKWCPVSKGMCILDMCMSFWKGNIFPKKIKYQMPGEDPVEKIESVNVYEPECTCAIVTGRMVIEQE